MLDCTMLQADLAPAPDGWLGKPVAKRRQRRGRMAAFAGQAAEDIAVRHFLARGCTVLDRRWRCPGGELDLVLLDGDVLVFVEVKQRKQASACESPISRHQWLRLEAAANQYMFSYQHETGVQPVCRFDVALVGHDGSANIIENAWSCLS